MDSVLQQKTFLTEKFSEIKVLVENKISNSTYFTSILFLFKIPLDSKFPKFIHTLQTFPAIRYVKSVTLIFGPVFKVIV